MRISQVVPWEGTAHLPVSIYLETHPGKEAHVAVVFEDLV